MKYMCFGYLDVENWMKKSQSEQNAMVNACLAYDEVLKKNGHWVSGEGLQGPDTAATLRYQNGKVSRTDGPYSETKELLGGLLILEARDLNHATQLISNHPGIKMGPWEIRPVQDMSDVIAESEKRRMSQANNSNAVLRTERVISATSRKIFAAFEKPELLAQWWGPSGFKNTFQQFEFKPGGRWVFVMHGPDGTDYPNESVFREIQPDTKIVIDHVVQPLFTLTVTLTARGDQTYLAWVQEFESAEIAAKLRHICEPANEQNLDRLEAVLKSKSS